MAVARFALVALAVVAGLVGTLLLGELPGLVLYLAYAGTGAYLAIRRPANHLGVLLLVVGWGIGLGSAGTYLPPGVDLTGDLRLQLVAVASNCGWPLLFIGMLAIILTFPEGRLPSGRFRWPARLALVAQTAIGLLIMTGPTITMTASVPIVIPNPIAVLPDSPVWRALPPTDGLYPYMLAPFIVGLGAMLGRWRRATGPVRQQFRWLIAAFVVEFAATLVWVVVTFVLGAQPNGPAWLLTVASFVAVPVAVAVSVLRYRLYEIDRIISRSVSWAAVTGILVATFVALVIGLQAALDGVTQGQTLAVAASTLAAFALFQPLRRRVQRAVDRRFDRARYDSHRTAETFAERLRDEVDLGAVQSSLTDLVEGSLRPVTMTLWLRGREEGR